MPEGPEIIDFTKLINTYEEVRQPLVDLPWAAAAGGAPAVESPKDPEYQKYARRLDQELKEYDL